MLGEVFHWECGEVLEQVSHRGCGCPVPVGVQGQLGWGPRQPDLVCDLLAGNPAHGREVGTEWSLKSLTTQAILWLSFCFSHTAVAVLLSNVSLLELLQKLLECTWMWSFPSEPTYLSSEDALLSSGWLLAASLLIYQHRYNTEVRAILVFRYMDLYPWL